MRREASLLLLGLSIYKAIRFISRSLNGNEPIAVDDSTKDDLILTQVDSPPSSHIVVSPLATKYDVFLSFRGKDTRHTFASYLCKGLCNAGIHTFMDYELGKGEHISQVLLRTIKESEISMIIFSEDYASSTWCLDELVHILECKEKFGRVVIPIFYNIDPSNIRKQNGSFGKRFNVLKRRFKDNPKKLQKWSDALFQSANISGWDSNSTRPEFKLVEKIVKDALSKLNYNSSYHLEGLIGIARHIRNIENLLSETRIVGIWGMGGAGKTTLAKAVFQELRAQYDAFSYIENVKEQLKDIGLDKLQRNCLRELLKDKEISIYDIKSASMKNRLGRKKILIILDDVDGSRIAEDLTNMLNWCGKGSRIIITSRDMQVLQNAYEKSKPRSTEATYHVPGLDFRNAIRLFSFKAFKQHEPSEGYMELSKSFVEYCQGSPLALVVLGCFLYGRKKEDWESALKKFEKDPPKDVVNVLKYSFDGLDEKQQNVFLDLVFLINERIDISLNRATQLYDSSTPIEISVLKEKSLISFNHRGRVVMHDLVKKMGLYIARNQLISDAKTPIRLWRHQDICDFFNRGKAIEAIRCMSVDVSMMKSMTLRASIFQKIRNLIFLKIYKSDWSKPSMLKIGGVLDYLSEELRFLSWEECPLPSVPLHFCAENLITLKMRNSNIRQLWKGNQHFPNLEKIDLSYSKHLTALPDLSQTPKIARLDLHGCVNLDQIRSSTFLRKDVQLVIYHCGPMQIKLGGSIKGRSSWSMNVSNHLYFHNLSFDKVTMMALVCDNMIYGFRLKHEVMSLEEREELRKEAQSLESLLPFVTTIEWFTSISSDDEEESSEEEEDGVDQKEESSDDDEGGDRGGMMNGHQVVMMSLMEDDKDDDVLMEHHCNESKRFTRVPKSMTRWSLLKKLTLPLKSLSHSNECCRRIKPHLDVTLIIPSSPLLSTRLVIFYDLDQVQQNVLRSLGRYGGLFFDSFPDSIESSLVVLRGNMWKVIKDSRARIKRKGIR
ncbi:hypothetical protein QN277_005570 [Acacia crassicarpa]|uniref:TIR domain-containing protein n=1 Tax=Acacia crassicarpa TaxID=499986 RepID=A0AAE1IYA8_9FABA|nr:hypothetical protein QN277_005570 [Acacia crassicarpa]